MTRRSDLSIKVDVLAGVSVDKAIKQMVGLAGQLGIDVEADLNGVKTRARPGVSASFLYEVWKREIESDRHYKYAIV